MEESESSKKEPSITFPLMKIGTTHVNVEREKVSKKTHNESLITRLTGFRFQMVVMINKNEDQLMSLGDRDSYYENFETTNLTKGKKGKTEYTYSNDLPPSFKNRTENTHNGAVVGQKKLIANSFFHLLFTHRKW